MAKNVFRSEEIVNLTNPVFLKMKKKFTEEPKKKEEKKEEYTGPTADDLRREAEEFKANWEKEKEAMISEAREQADKIVEEAKEKAFEDIEEKNNEIQKKKQEADDEAGRIIETAKAQAEEDVKTAEARVKEIEDKAYEKGYSEGSEKGYGEGKAEVERLIKQLQSIISKSIDKRNEIIDESETQLINLVLNISRKIIKVISENQKNVVINNVIQALRKLKTQGEVIIRVNMNDVKLTTEHIKDFISMIENVRSITVLEDSSVDPGGCIIETDFGEIDARIFSQLHEIEEKILELMPIKSRVE